MEFKAHGENGITYSLFNEISSKNKVKEFLNYVRWNDKSFLKELIIESVHLFPSFGRGRSGLGEPDAIIIADKSVIYVEVETSNMNLEPHFYYQFSNFMLIGESIFRSDKKKIRSKFIINDTKKIRGKYRTRKLVKDLLSKKREPHYVLICDGTPNELNRLNNQLNKNKIKTDKVGYISFRTIKRLPFITKTKEVINYNLK